VTSSPTTGERAIDEALRQLLERFPDPTTSDPADILGAQYDLGLAWVHFGKGFGGLAVAAGLQTRVDEVLRTRGFPPTTADFIGFHQCATAINAVGTVAQKTRFLRPIFTGAEHWCQLFSEPGAGSDLAGLSTAAYRDGEEWVVNGQKVWTSGAADARWAILVARTDPAVPKHRGITFFICDMEAPGVVVRPLRQADGGAHFNEVFLTDVHLPDSMRLGDVGQGWGISITALHSERDGTGAAFSRPIAAVVALWRDRSDRTSPQALALRDELTRLWIESRVVEMSNLRMRAALETGGSTPLGSLAKIASSEHAQRVAQLATTIMGPAGQVDLHYDDALMNRDEFDSIAGMSPQRFAVRSRAMSIEGGTNEIQRNIIGERVLGLTGDPRTDKTLPWRDVPRG
jgi:alkylation response protein AidB-like acyl-CoA dehydrogenase